MKNVKYICNLCHTEIGENLNKKLGFGVYYSATSQIIIKYPAQAENHICDECLKELRSDAVGKYADELRKYKLGEARPA